MYVYLCFYVLSNVYPSTVCTNVQVKEAERASECIFNYMVGHQAASATVTTTTTIMTTAAPASAPVAAINR